MGCNVDSFTEALLKECTVSPDLDDEDWEGLCGTDGVLSPRQFDELCKAAWDVNKEAAPVPFFSRALRMLESASA